MSQAYGFSANFLDDLRHRQNPDQDYEEIFKLEREKTFVESIDILFRINEIESVVNESCSPILILR